MVPQTDFRYDDWPSRKPSAAARRRYQRENATVAQRAGTVVREAVVATARSATARRSIARGVKEAATVVREAGGVRAVASAMGALTMGEIAGMGAAAIAGTAAVAVAAGLASYYLTTWAMERFRPRTMDEKIHAAAMAYAEARKDLVRRTGRPVTPAENDALAQVFRARKREIAIEYNQPLEGSWRS